MTRAPFFELEDAGAAFAFTRWVEERLPEIREQVERVSRHARLVGIEPMQLGRGVHLRFAYETGDAAGQNMTTACTWRACRWIVEQLAEVPQLAIRRHYVEGNTNGDKKLAQLSLHETRGCRVTAECRLDRETIRDVLKVEPEAFLAACRTGTLGALQSGMIGHSINTANLVAAVFTATGQDIACTHESGSAVFTLEPEENGVYATILLPALVVGTVGGGTGLPKQQDYLELLGCAGADRVRRFAELIAGFALALDLSTLAAVAAGHFARAHERLGRNRPVEWFTAKELTPSFFSSVMNAEVVEAVAREGAAESAVLSDLASTVAGQKLVGVVPMRLTLRDRELDVVVKSKALDRELILATNRIASLCGGRFADEYSRWRDWTGFKGTHARELGLYRSAPAPLRALMPEIHGLHENAAREAHIIVMEDVSASVNLKDTADDVRGWGREQIEAALTGIAGAHAVWLGREQELLAQDWIGPVLDARRMTETRDLWMTMAEHNAAEYRHWVDPLTLTRVRHAVSTIPDWWAELEHLPRTLVHNDFNPRNIALRKDSGALVAYDWELATLHVPQRDLVELLAFVLWRDVDPATVTHHIEVHRRALERAAGTALDPVQWRRGYRLALWDYALTRLGLYMVSHTQRELAFLDRVVATVKRLVAIEIERERHEHAVRPPRLAPARALARRQR
jgi:hydroxymethylglutaryl-CoA reductase (NADPH)